MRQNEEITISRFTTNDWSVLTGVKNVPITIASRRKFHLMQEDSITLVFSLDEPLSLEIGDFITDEIFGTFMLREKQFPAYNKATGGYDYQLRFDRPYWLWENHINMLCAPTGSAYINRSTSSGTTVMTYNGSDSFKRQESVWCLTAKLADHAEQVLCNIIAAGMTYYGRHYRVRIHPTATKANEIRFINYDATHICTALNAIAEAYECEWWVTYESDPKIGYINFGKCEYYGGEVEPTGKLPGYYIKQNTSSAAITSASLSRIVYYQVRAGETWEVRCEGAAPSNHVEYALFDAKPTVASAVTNYVNRSGNSNVEVLIQSDGYLALSAPNSVTPICKRLITILKLADNVETMQASRDLTNYANRIYAFGGTQNVPTSYRKKLILDVDTSVTVDGITLYKDSTREINPYTMLADSGTEGEPTLFQFPVFGQGPEIVTPPTDPSQIGDNQIANYTNLTEGSVIVFRAVAKNGNKTTFGFKRDTVVSYDAISGGFRFAMEAQGESEATQELRLFLENVNDPTEKIYLSANSVTTRQNFINGDTTYTRTLKFDTTEICPQGKVTLAGGKTYKLVLAGKIIFKSVDVNWSFNGRDYVDDGKGMLGVSGSLSLPSGKSFAARVVFNGTEYPITFNPLKALEGEEYAEYFTFPNGTPSNFAVDYDAEVEYLQSSGTQYIDTNVAFTDGFAWEVKFEGGQRDKSIIGARSSSVRTSCLYYYSTSARNYTMPIGSSNGLNTPFNLGISGTGVHVVKAEISSSKGNVWVDGEQKYANQSFSGNYISNVSCAMFSSKYGNNDFREKTSAKIYYFKMWQGSTLVCDFIPVRKDGVGYMYDKVSGELFGNDGTGSFTYGNDVAYPGSTADLLDYISSEIPQSHYTDDTDDPSSLIGLGDRRLRLPTSTNGYVETDDLLEVQRVEMAVKMDDIYPKCYLKVTDVATNTLTDRMEYPDGTRYEWDWTAYTLQLAMLNGGDFPFKRKFVKEGEKLQAYFLSDYEEETAYTDMGLPVPTPDPTRYLLAGMTFDVAFKETYPGEEYTIIRNEDFGAKLPSSKLMPKVGDVLVLTGWDVEAIEQLNLVAAAEEQLETAALDYLDAMQEDGWTFRCSMMSGGVICPDGTISGGVFFPEGLVVDVFHDALTDGHKKSRVIGYELKLDIPEDSPVYEVGETDAYSRIKQLEKKIQSL